MDGMDGMDGWMGGCVCVGRNEFRNDFFLREVTKYKYKIYNSIFQKKKKK